MCSSNLPPYILQELWDITETINCPLKDASRIKYTCFTVSQTLIIFGATSGGVYIFNREPCEFLQLIPSKDGAITRLSISEDEKYVAFANEKGLVHITECRQNDNRSSICSQEHQGSEVTALRWSSTPQFLYAGDDVGKISILQIPTLISKTMFQPLSQIIMSLDSRICQIDTEQYLLLVSTLSRCYICDTSKEQYRQIGQKLRDGEFGACFVTSDKNIENGSDTHHIPSVESEIKNYHILGTVEDATLCEKFANTHIYSARPSARLWEASVDGIVKRTHQFKHVLSRGPTNILNRDGILKASDNTLDRVSTEDGQSVNFPKIYSMKSRAIFSYTKSCIYFLNPENVEYTIWSNHYEQIVDCKVIDDLVYLWLKNGSIVTLMFSRVDDFLANCFFDEKYILCAQACALHSEYLLNSNHHTKKLTILLNLREKLVELKENDLLQRIAPILDQISKKKTSDATQLKSGIYIVENLYQMNKNCGYEKPEMFDENKFMKLSPEAIQALKDLSLTVTDKFSTSKKRIIEKWEGLEEKMKNFGVEKQEPFGIREPADILTEVTNSNIVTSNESPPKEIRAHAQSKENILYKQSSQDKNISESNTFDSTDDTICKELFESFISSLTNKQANTHIYYLLENLNCDINRIHKIMIRLEAYCISVGAQDSKYIPSYIFLTYISSSPNKVKLFEEIISKPYLNIFFVDSCINVNVKTQKIENLACECGFPLPYAKSTKKPLFSDLIDDIVEKQWLSRSENECYQICKKMPYLWRKILYLRRNEDLQNILTILLQILDETLLHTFLPQFTYDIWDKALQLFATLNTNLCLNCSKKFENVNVRDALTWDGLGALLLTSVSGKNALKLMGKHAHSIAPGELSMKFYHSCMLVALYEKYDGTIRSQLTETLYAAFEYEDARKEICNLLKASLNGEIKDTSLPLLVAAKSPFWGLNVDTESATGIPVEPNAISSLENVRDPNRAIDLGLQSILNNFEVVNKDFSNCALCGLPVVNEVLIKDGGLWVFRCGHTFHGVCLNLLRVKLCPSCSAKS